MSLPGASRDLLFFESRLDQYLADLSYLAGIDSGSDDKAGVDRVVDWLQARFHSLGCAAERQPQPLLGDNLIARLRGEGGARILLLGHSDTVYPRGTSADRPVRIDGDRVLGPGTCDMKAGILSGIYALEALIDQGWRDFDVISFLIVSDEETSERGSIPLIEREGANHDVVLTLEAARENGDIVSARKGVRWFTAEARGRAAHAGVEPEKGRSATLAIARLIDAVSDLNGKTPGMTVNAGQISGGGSPSVVVDRAIARFDLRAWTDEELDDLEHFFRDVCAREFVPGVQTSVVMEPGSDCPAMPRTEAVASMENMAVTIASELEFGLHGAATGGASDVSYAMRSGTPGLDGLGPIGGLDHGPDEYILLSSIVPRQALLARLLIAVSERRIGQWTT